MNPVCIFISLFAALLNFLLQKGAKGARRGLAFMLPAVILTCIINPLFNHSGATVLTYFPNGSPLTLESVIYGFFASLMLASVVCHFASFGEIMTSDKIICLFGKLLPSLSLIFSMTLRFVPRFLSQAKKVYASRRAIGKAGTAVSVKERVSDGLAVLSSLASWALENSQDTADSMKARGYGLPGRSSFSVFRLDKYDVAATVYIMLFGIYTLGGAIVGVTDFSFFPRVNFDKISPYGVSVFAAYFMLCIFPFIADIREVIRWKN